jgi:hypothetical protein
MKLVNKIALVFVFLVVVATGIFWLKPGPKLGMGVIIATAVPSDIDLRNDDLGIDNRYIPRASIIAVESESKNSEPVILTEDFYSARSPEVSYDGNMLVFSGQKTAQDNWQIYTMDLQSFKVLQVTQCPVNCTDPAWLPDGRIAFSRLNEEESAGQIHVLHACKADGSEMKRLMYHPNSAVSASVFQDGRILVISTQKYPEAGKGHMLALRIDGTKSELFFRTDRDEVPVNRAWEAPGGQMYFVEQVPGRDNPGKLVTVSKGHPMSSHVNISKKLSGDFHSIYPDSSDDLVVSYRENSNGTFGLHAYDPDSRKLNNSIYNHSEFHIIEPVMRQVRENPMKLPPIVNESKKKGTLLCLNTDQSMISVNDKESNATKTDKVQVLGIDGLLGEVEVEKDGSFYIEIDTDKPVRFQTINAEGEMLRGPSAWIWVRPGERRSCVGCHEDPELAPENRVPDALYAGMVSLPEGTRSEAIVLNGKIKEEHE